MSGFDQNPFADPRNINPFSDPAVTQVTRQATRTTASLDDYNPFAAEDANRPPAQARGAANPPPTMSQPAVMNPTNETPPPPYQPPPNKSSATVNTDELLRKQQELEKRAAELEAREEALRKASGPLENNWPPIPSFIPIKPCFFQDIELEIPVEFQKLVRIMYYFWIYYCCLIIANFLGALVLLIGVGSDYATTFGVSILYLILLIPLSFLCWFRPLYKAFKFDSSFNFMVFFFVFFFQLIWAILHSIGFYGMNTCGLFLAFAALNKNTGIGVFILLLSFASIAFAIGNLIMLIRIHRIYRQTGASLAKAQTEFTTGVFQNQYVQEAATTAATRAAQEAARQAVNPNRY